PVKYLDPTGLSKRDIIIADLISYAIGGKLGYAFNKHMQKVNDEYRTQHNEKREIEGNPEYQEEWKSLPKEESKFHQPENGDKATKYVTNDGKGEIVWNDTKNEKVTDPKIKGTYNYAGNCKILHGLLDVLPWIIYGTGIDDPSNIEDRLKQTFEGAQEIIDKKAEGLVHEIHQNMTPQGINAEAGKKESRNEKN
ncbi:MAG: hypothetical protein HUJ68_08100, partial [Clostridia bacterium]|nr:hypothetical protein [Clostridia bacterium]